MFKYIIISIIGSITNLLPISYSTHIYIYQNLFNTKIFENTYLINTIYLSIPISILLTYKKDIINNLILPIKHLLKKDKTKYKKQITIQNIFLLTCIFSTLITYYIPKLNKSLKTIPIYLFILSIIILLSINKNGYKKQNNLSFKDSLIFSLSHIINSIPTISPLCSNLLISKYLNFNKSLSIKYSLLTILPIYLIKSFNIINYLLLNTNYIPYYLLSTLISTIINLKIINYLKDLYYNNKLYKLSIYTFILGLFLLYWFR